MIATNDLIISFTANNWILIIILVLILIASIWKVVPHKWSFGPSRDGIESPYKTTILSFVLHNVIDTLVRTFAINFVTAFGMKDMVSLLIFIVVISDVFVKNEISTQAVSLISVGIIALYMDKLVETGKTIKFLGSLFTWERRN